jgi:membrane-associated phospholipid phosphatase
VTHREDSSPTAFPTPTFRAIAPLVVVASLAVVALVAPFPGGSLSVAVTSAAATAGFAVPGIEFLSDALLLALAAVTAAVLLHAWWRTPEHRARVIAGGAGVALAYLGSEAGKVLFAQRRPCTRWPAAATCDVADYSFPSNHATLAFAAACVVAIVGGRLLWTILTVALAVAVAAGRLLEGVHYLHDVAVGAIWGIIVPTLVVLTVEVVRVRRRDRG